VDKRQASASVKFNGFSQPADLTFSFSAAGGQEQEQPRTTPSRRDSSELNWHLKFDKKLPPRRLPASARFPRKIPSP
jgi:hypothetical protein